MRKQAHYSIDHPVAIALSGMVCALRTGGDLLAAPAERAEAAGVAGAAFAGLAARDGTEHDGRKR